MLTDDRCKQLMAQVGMPNSKSLMQALRQCDMEATLAERDRCSSICLRLPYGTGLAGRTYSEAILGKGYGAKLAHGDTQTVPANSELYDK